MNSYPNSANRLIEEFSRLPGIGKKTAQRLAFFILNSDMENIKSFADSLVNIKNNIMFCNNCGIMCEEEICLICKDHNRDESLICIVEEAQDIYSFEKTNSFKGRYHVLGGLLSPLDGVGPEDLNLESLYKRLKKGMEVILATNPSVEGDTTCLYLAKIIEDMGIKVTRLARGIPIGGDLEYTDELTLLRAIEGRTEL